MVFLLRLSELWTDEVSGRKTRRDALSPDKKRRRPSVVSDILQLLIILCFFTFIVAAVSRSLLAFLLDCLHPSASTILNFAHDHISSICCLIWIFWRTGQLSERYVHNDNLSWANKICLCACFQNAYCVIVWYDSWYDPKELGKQWRALYSRPWLLWDPTEGRLTTTALHSPSGQIGTDRFSTAEDCRPTSNTLQWR